MIRLWQEVKLKGGCKREVHYIRTCSTTTQTMVEGNDDMVRHWRSDCWSCSDSANRIPPDSMGGQMSSRQELAIMGFIYLCIGSIIVIVKMFAEVIDK